jgi:hypothetical protein
MNETFICIVVAMIVPAITVIGVVILERRNVPAKEPIAKIVLVIPLLSELPLPIVTRWQWLRSWLNKRILSGPKTCSSHFR